MQDVIAGLSIAGLLLPEAVAYSTIGNMPPQTGIVALFAGLLCYGLLGTSRFAIVSATSSSAAVLAAATFSFADVTTLHRLSLAFGLVIITGGIFLLAAACKMGKVTDFISKPVLRGFAFGLAIIIITKQFANMTGVHPIHSNAFWFLTELLAQISSWNFVGIAIGFIALGLLILLRDFKRIPGALLVIALGIMASQWLNLADYHVSIVGPILLKLEMPSVPQLTQEEWLRLGELGFAMAMILYSESYSAIRVFAIKSGGAISPNRDLLALGIANLVSGVFHGLPVGAGYSATSANENAGATSRLSGLSASLVIFLIVLTLLPKIALTPEPVLAAIVINAVSHTLNPAVFRQYFIWRRDRIVIIASVVAVLWLGVLDGLLAAIGLSIMMMLKRFSDSTVSLLGRIGDSHDFVDLANHPDATAIKGVMILRPEEPLFFANAEPVFSEIKFLFLTKGADTNCIIISLEECPDLDSTSLEALQDFANFITKQQKKLIFARAKISVQELLRRTMTESLNSVIITDLSVNDAVSTNVSH